jgi:fumarate reductase flavoprotein subunit
VAEGTVKGGSLVGRPGAKPTDVDKELQLEAANGTVKIADSWDEIANWAGIDAKALKATIDEYNSFCDQGYDEIFAKDQRYLQPLRNPPYYAMRGGSGLLVTFGGVKINHHMEALNQQDEPIPGLYAVGNDAGGWEGDTYDLDLSGFAFGFAVNSGRIAGENAAKYASKK